MGRKPLFSKVYKLNDPKVYEVLAKLEKSYVDVLEDVNKLVDVYEEEKEIYKSREDKLFSIRQAYEYLKKNGVGWSYEIFKGRVDRESIPYVLGEDGVKYIQKSTLDEIIDFESQVMSLDSAYKSIHKVYSKLSLRAFIGRIEKDKIPVIIRYRKRYIPKEVVSGLVYLYTNYVDVNDAVKIYRENNINITKNTLERRLDRGLIPFVKYGKLRMIPKDVLMESIKEEKSKL